MPWVVNHDLHIHDRQPYFLQVQHNQIHRANEFARDELLLYILYFGSAFVGAIVYSRIRYRIPFDFLLIAMVAIFMGHLKNDIVFNWHMSKILRVPAAWWSSRAFFMIKVNK